jgi:glycosyltransferase involved in cell wall biosynthesis
MKQQEYADVSVVIPCFKCADTIARAVNSISSQTFLPKEVILVEDNSEDHTLETLYTLKNTYSPEWITVIPLSKNIGAGEARNAGWDIAIGQYIAFLDADDIWHPRKIDIQYRWMKKHPDVILTGHRSLQIAENTLEAYQASTIKEIHFKKIKKYHALLSNPVSTRSAIIKREIKQRFPYKKRFSEDYQLWLDVICEKKHVYTSDLTLGYSFKAPYGEKGLSSKLWEMQKGEINTYKQIYPNCIGTIALSTVCLISYLKFIKRLIISRYS